jgi:hypothetical protein
VSALEKAGSRLSACEWQFLLNTNKGRELKLPFQTFKRLTAISTFGA